MKKGLTILLLCIAAFHVQAQDPNEKGNMSDYYYKPLRFGFMLGVHQATFNTEFVEHFEKFDTLKTVRFIPQFGFNLGMVSEFAFHKHFTLRFVPNIAFSERRIEYTFEGYEDLFFEKIIESTFLNFPLDLKIRSKRYHNFSSYIIGGVAYNMDLASKKNQEEEITPVWSKQTVKITRDDFSYQIGGGVEFYFMYFKLGIEGKLSLGTNNLIIPESTVFTDPIKKLNSKVFLISFTFEG